jgi:RNA polymerase sigma factor (TIGR02999 family)
MKFRRLHPHRGPKPPGNLQSQRRGGLVHTLGQIHGLTPAVRAPLADTPGQSLGRKYFGFSRTNGHAYCAGCCVILALMVGDLTDSDEKLIGAIYPELRAMAGRLLRKERDAHTLQRTALAHEALLRLFKNPPPPTTPIQEFLALAAHQMRNVLIDYGRRRSAQRRGASLVRVPLCEAEVGVCRNDDEFLALDEALERLGLLDRRSLAVVELKYFSGCTTDQTAEILGVSDGTVEQDWKFARSWLHQELTKPDARSRINTLRDES